MNILFTLCGRAGSKGFKNKNLKLFLGIPLAYYSIAAIALYMESSEAEGHRVHTVLNTDSPELISTVQAQDKVPVAVIARDQSLGGDAVPKVAVIRDCLDKMECREKTGYDMAVDLDITSPLRTLGNIRDAIQKKGGRQDTDVVYSVTESRRNPFFNMVKEENGYFCKAMASEYTMRQQAPVFYDMNASIYAYSVDALRTKKPEVFLMTDAMPF